jgi:hypothetical protein
MTSTSEPSVYRPNRRTGVIVFLLGLVIFTFGLALLTGLARATVEGQPTGKAEVELHVFTWAFVLIGGWLTVMSGVGLTGRVVVHGQGLTKSFRFLRRGFSFSWDAVESWSVQVRDPHETPTRVAWFTVRDRRWPADVWEDEAARPSFEQFLQDVRAHVGAKEQEHKSPLAHIRAWLGW